MRRTEMNIFIIIWNLSMAGSVVESAATRSLAMLSANSKASVEATNIGDESVVIGWLQITAVPLGVFLIGALIWAIFKTTAASCRNSMNIAPGAEGAPEADHQVPADHRVISMNGPNAQDLEEGLELPHRRMDGGIDLATAPNSPPDARDGMQQIPAPGIQIPKQ